MSEEAGPGAVDSTLLLVGCSTCETALGVKSASLEPLSDEVGALFKPIKFQKSVGIEFIKSSKENPVLDGSVSLLSVEDGPLEPF